MYEKILNENIDRLDIFCTIINQLCKSKKRFSQIEKDFVEIFNIQNK